MRPSDVTQALVSLIPTKRPLYLWGPPGVGKSSLVKAAAQQMDLMVADVRAVLLDPVDLRGVPSVENHTTIWAVPNFLPKEGKGVLFLDELAQAPPLVQAACLQLTLDRRVGEYLLPDGWSIVAASNRQEDRAGAHRLISPLLNRFIHMDLEVSNEDWQAWAIEGIAPEVRAFLNFRPALLFAFDPSLTGTGARSFPTPRSWEFVSDVLDSTPAHLLHPIISGCVGEGPAAEMVGFLQVWRELPRPEEVLARPLTATVPKSPAVLFALTGSLVEHLRQEGGKVVSAFASYAGRLPDEFSVLMMRDGNHVYQKMWLDPIADKWLASARGKGICGGK